MLKSGLPRKPCLGPPEKRHPLLLGRNAGFHWQSDSSPARRASRNDSTALELPFSVGTARGAAGVVVELALLTESQPEAV